jgi:RNA polymerase sigma factor FliA
VESVTSSHAQVLQRAPDEGEIAEKLGMKVESLRLRMLRMRSATRISTTSRADEDLPPPEFSTGAETHPDAICAQQELQNTVRVTMKKLPQRDQKILLSYYCGEMTMNEIGGMLGVNESRISALHKRAILRMELLLRARGITSSQPL